MKFEKCVLLLLMSYNLSVCDIHWPAEFFKLQRFASALKFFIHIVIIGSLHWEWKEAQI